LRYKATSSNGTVHGFGQSRIISSKEVIFEPGAGLEPGMKAEIAIAWPVLLDGHIRLQLVLDATISRSEGSTVEARIFSYHFRTRGLAETWQKSDLARIEPPQAVVDRPLAVAHA
jgi:hypothetical protein